MAEPNKAGRPIWFRHVDGGAYQPVGCAGVLVFAAAIAWVLLCGTAGMVAFALTQDPRCFVAALVALVPGLVWVGVTVARHS